MLLLCPTNTCLKREGKATAASKGEGGKRKKKNKKAENTTERSSCTECRIETIVVGAWHVTETPSATCRT